MLLNLYNIGYEKLTKFFSLYYVKYITIFVIICFVLSLAVGILLCIISGILLCCIVSYFILKMLKLSIDDNNILFYQYNKKSKKILDLYGNCKITKMYLVRQPFTKFLCFVLNIFSLYNFDKLIKESQDNCPYHVFIMFEISLDNGMKKMILLEKNNCINISENFIINNSQEIKQLKIKKHYTINYILNKTQSRLGNETYFNWHIFKNNCQCFIKEILTTIGKYNKFKKEFIFRDKIFKIIIFSDFIYHIGFCLYIIYNVIEKYIYDSIIFN